MHSYVSSDINCNQSNGVDPLCVRKLLQCIDSLPVHTPVIHEYIKKHDLLKQTLTL